MQPQQRKHILAKHEKRSKCARCYKINYKDYERNIAHTQKKKKKKLQCEI